MRLYIVRHGETFENRAQVLQGQSHNSLSDIGKAQAQALANRFCADHIDAVYSSDLARAVETARAIAVATALQVTPLEGLRERNYGAFQGRSPRDYEAAVRNSIDSEKLFRPEGGETLQEMEDRVATILQAVISKHPKESVVIVSHSGPIRLMLQQLFGVSHPNIVSLQQQNGCVNLIELTGEGNPVAVMINCTAHFSEQGLCGLGMYE